MTPPDLLLPHLRKGSERRCQSSWVGGRSLRQCRDSKYYLDPKPKEHQTSQPGKFSAVSTLVSCHKVSLELPFILFFAGTTNIQDEISIAQSTRLGKANVPLHSNASTAWQRDGVALIERTDKDHQRTLQPPPHPTTETVLRTSTQAFIRLC